MDLTLATEQTKLNIEIWYNMYTSTPVYTVHYYISIISVLLNDDLDFFLAYSESFEYILSKENFNGHASFSVSQFNVSQNGDFKCFRRPYYIRKKQSNNMRVSLHLFSTLS